MQPLGPAAEAVIVAAHIFLRNWTYLWWLSLHCFKIAYFFTRNALEEKPLGAHFSILLE